MAFEPEALKSKFKKIPATMNLAGAWRIKPLQNDLKTVALDSNKIPKNFRLQAIMGLAAFGDTKTLAMIASDPKQDKAIVAPTLKLLAGVNTQLSAKLTTQFLRQLSADELKQYYSIIEVFINRKKRSRGTGQGISQPRTKWTISASTRNTTEQIRPASQAAIRRNWSNTKPEN